MSFCCTLITPAAFPCASINWGWWLPPWIELEAVNTFSLTEMDLWISPWIYGRYSSCVWPSISLPAWEDDEDVSS